ncbi:iron complex transport system substrate-binding protein [Pseudomonas nitritireducens]|uniref:Iron complex transport system substrate-binding protein n=1 Tax=Pseudomonas nitroreducens TaxID=46680 RepID=A0A7W7KHM5_PSENT|nr:ABC transporter substrate-binding protein [Pseudomonas nitritireducens]MBB4862665.1 iron complex transport system substrate-binding protein [Pseudomonas nitritireducens]
MTRRPPRSYRLTLGLTVALMLSLATASAQDYRNCAQTWSIDHPPQRILALNQHAADLLLALGVGKRLIGVAYIDDDLDIADGRYRGVPLLSRQYPSAEAVYAQRPDLVVAGFASAFRLGNLSREELGEHGVASYLLDAGCGVWQNDLFAGVETDLQTLGDMLGETKRAQQLIRRQRAELAEARRLFVGSKPLEVFYLDSASNGLESQGRRGVVTQLLHAAGAHNLFEDVDLGGFTASTEQLLARDPDVILLADALWSTAAQKVRTLRADPVLSQLRAVREGRFVALPFTHLFPGVHSGEAARELAQALEGF